MLLALQTCFRLLYGQVDCCGGGSGRPAAARCWDTAAGGPARAPPLSVRAAPCAGVHAPTIASAAGVYFQPCLTFHPALSLPFTTGLRSETAAMHARNHLALLALLPLLLPAAPVSLSHVHNLLLIAVWRHPYLPVMQRDCLLEPVCGQPGCDGPRLGCLRMHPSTRYRLCRPVRRFGRLARAL